MKLLILLLASTLACRAMDGAPELDMQALEGPLRNLRAEEQKIFDDALRLIQKGEHTLAYLSLSRLLEKDSKNSAFRVIRSYIALQLGNLLGALDDARKAEASRPHDAYRCWFLAKVSFLAGDSKICRREIGHIGSHPKYGPEAKKLEEQLRSKKQ